MPEAVWVSKFLNDTTTKVALGVPATFNFTWLNMDMFNAFNEAGDL